MNIEYFEYEPLDAEFLIEAALPNSINIEHAAYLLDLPIEEVERLVEHGTVPAIRIARTTRFIPEQLGKYLISQSNHARSGE